MREKEKIVYLLFDVGGTQIKASISDEVYDKKKKICSYPSLAKEDAGTIMKNFAFILEELMKQVPDAVIGGIGMAFPGPFDYENGMSLMKGINKYDSIYGRSIEQELKKLVPRIRNVKFSFMHDIEAFALGESWFGKMRNENKILCLCIGTGAGSAFVEKRIPIKEEREGVPANGWIYRTPYKDSMIDDYLSVRGISKISQELFGHPKSGKELFELCEKGDKKAFKVWEIFGNDLKQSILPFLLEFQPDAVIMGGQISKSFPYFGQEFDIECRRRKIKICVEEETSERTMQGLLIKMTRGDINAES